MDSSGRSSPPKKRRADANGHGGARSGAGRPKGQGRWGEPTVPVRVPQSRVTVVKALLDTLPAVNGEDQKPPNQVGDMPVITRARASTKPLSPDAWSDLLTASGLIPLQPATVAPVLTLPLFGYRIAAGFPSPADDYVEERIDLNRHLIRHKEATFFLRVQGDSMINAGIHDGDMLIVDRAIEPVSGKIVIAALDGELTVKRLSASGGVVRLLPENPDYPVIEIGAEQELVVWGVVIHVIHALG
ncbi:Peptidase S24/S26A/S26B, conserved region [Halothiobacillus neapolitanus c2]|uniref:Peptidase S24/S26A/S26B, conserved region n=1 Tax=Halothiobacillus neapolitanus (strain ATCC 23641 / DSM 15147 / CIP 104769 / NCIMB 8539 / c2) TaxID=555778 RepID=D0KZ55_HALNC|nr:translesion error-prone DNA polymerase V autoproteolytic subunit [Halothiobacillus neapolitanus]ACX95728.1 Peptidase S24/S26A/S26B, conserved region [Halothiobacillus neapolitanus c2]TDN66034.1 DNA polymerase V [Halothiobacillus neapolitanus]